MRKEFTNKEILHYAEFLSKTFLDDTSKDVILPIKANFYLQKNMRTFLEAGEEIDEMRLKIGEKYGEYDSQEESYSIKDPEKLKLAKQDLKDLLSVTQVLEIYSISLDELADVNLTVTQMNALFFMIEE